MFRSLGDLMGASMIATDGGIGRIATFFLTTSCGRFVIVSLMWTLARPSRGPHFYERDRPAGLEDKDIACPLDQGTASKWSGRRFEEAGVPAAGNRDAGVLRMACLLDTVVDKVFPPNLIPAGREFPVHTEEDNHLRSWEDVIGYEVWASDGVVGYLESFVVNEAVWHIGYLDVKTGDWLQSRSVLVPTSWVKSISWADHHVNLQGSESGFRIDPHRAPSLLT